jgi:hypothetical protein
LPAVAETKCEALLHEEPPTLAQRVLALWTRAQWLARIATRRNMDSGAPEFNPDAMEFVPEGFDFAAPAPAPVAAPAPAPAPGELGGRTAGVRQPPTGPSVHPVAGVCKGTSLIDCGTKFSGRVRDTAHRLFGVLL